MWIRGYADVDSEAPVNPESQHFGRTCFQQNTQFLGKKNLDLNIWGYIRKLSRKTSESHNHQQQLLAETVKRDKHSASIHLKMYGNIIFNWTTGVQTNPETKRCRSSQTDSSFAEPC